MAEANCVPGHSMTIVGFEKRTDGTCNLLVFDPAVADDERVVNMVDRTVRHSAYEDMLRQYRKGPAYLNKHDKFEILLLETKEGNFGDYGLIVWLGLTLLDAQNFATSEQSVTIRG